MEQTKNKQDFASLINSGKPVLVDFYATWCGPCKMMTPVLDELKGKMGDKAYILKIDVDKNPSAAAAFNIRGVPTLLAFKNAKVMWRQSGVVPLQELEKILNGLMT
ncbi:MAG: thioredoxin [Bacteroidia bacterium]|nr:thioredoxin [Bacteroidia bacterium]